MVGTCITPCATTVWRRDGRWSDSSDLDPGGVPRSSKFGTLGRATPRLPASARPYRFTHCAGGVQTEPVELPPGRTTPRASERVLRCVASRASTQRPERGVDDDIVIAHVR